MHTTSGGRVAWQSTSDGENSYSHWAQQQLRGRSRRARSSRRCRYWLAQRGIARYVRGASGRVSAGPKETGYVEGQNVAIELPMGRGQLDRLAGLAADLVQRRVAVIARPAAARHARPRPRRTIPIVFLSQRRPDRPGLVASFNRPGGNATGMTLLTGPWWQSGWSCCRSCATARRSATHEPAAIRANAGSTARRAGRGAGASASNSIS